jgi:hypothetical protein
MIYHNDRIEEKEDYVIGSIGDLKEYFRYQLASLCMTGKECDYEEFRDNVNNIIDLLDNLYEDTMNNILSDLDVVKVSKHPMGSFMIENEVEDNE